MIMVTQLSRGTWSIALIMLIILGGFSTVAFHNRASSIQREVPVERKTAENDLTDESQPPARPGLKPAPVANLSQLASAPVNLWPKSAALDQAIVAALDAHTADRAVEILAPMADDFYAHQHLRLVGSLCVGAERTTSAPGPVEIDTVEGQLRIKLSEFLKTYCGDVSALKKKIAAISAQHPTASMSEREEYIEALFATQDSEAKANAIINEILISPDLRESVFQTTGLNNLLKENGPLSSWRKHLRRYASTEDSRVALEIAGELINCPRLGGCGVNQFHLTYECSGARNCRPGEDLFAYRRRTTSPELFEAAERIAIEMRNRRSQ